jgi:hypothetical protein
MDALGCCEVSTLPTDPTWCEQHEEAWGERGCPEALLAADAAFAASLEWAAERVEGPSEIPRHASTCV